MAVTALLTFCRMLYHMRIKPESIRRSHDVSAAVYAILGVLYGIILGFITIQSQERWLELRDVREKEAAVIISIGEIAKTLSESSSRSIIQAITVYARKVAETEWDDDREASPEGALAIRNVVKCIVTMESTTDRNLLASQTLLQLSSDLIGTRVLRLNLLREHIGSMLWLIMILGGIIMTAFLLLFAPENVFMHTAMIFIVASLIISVLFLVYSYEHPTDGPFVISADPYQRAAMILMGE